MAFFPFSRTHEAHNTLQVYSHNSCNEKLYQITFSHFPVTTNGHICIWFSLYQIVIKISFSDFLLLTLEPKHVLLESYMKLLR